MTEQQIFDGEIDENYVNLVKFEIARAREYYVQVCRSAAAIFSFFSCPTVSTTLRGSPSSALCAAVRALGVSLRRVDCRARS